MKSKKKLILIIVGVVVVVAIVVANLTMDTTNETKVQAEKTKLKKITELVSASGRIQPRTKVDITSEINGEVISLYAKEGDRVDVGQLLIVLDTIQLRSDVDQARFAVSEIEARLQGSKASLDKAREDYDRQKRLHESNLSSENEFNNSHYAYLNAKAAYEANLAQADQFRSRYDKQLDYLSKAKIVAPMSGIITYLDAEVGEIAAAQTAFTQGKTLMTISDLNIFEVEVEVDETEINKISVAQECSIEVDAFPDTAFAGEVTEIGNTAVLTALGTENQSTNFNVKIVFADPNVKIRPGMSATVDITTATREDALTIPYSSVVMRTYDMDSLFAVREGKANFDGGVQAAEADSVEAKVEDDEEEKHQEFKGVFVIRDGEAQFVPIETGIADKKSIEVTAGLNEGDSVISGPYRVLRTIKDGETVSVEQKSSKKEN
ncbi:MAG: efflux RND transporter periplasmic adaptor subunit [bacterium]|nr:efflux RND transporter periplasmic adaptor subunit [bacterium]